MTTRVLIKDIIAGKKTKRCGFWMGNPADETITRYIKESGLKSLEEIRDYLGDDIVWITPQYIKSTYTHPVGKPMRPWKNLNPHGMAGGTMADYTTVEEVLSYDWPSVEYLDFSECISRLKDSGDRYRLSGFWAPFFHDLTYLIGTEELLIKMCIYPEVIHAILEKLCGFYYHANELFYSKVQGLMDGFFFGNDFGTQNDLLISPEQFDEFYLPWIKKFSEQAHNYGYQSIMHCCGSIYRIIDRLIDAGVDCIHPIQAQAKNMDAQYLKEHFKNRITFMGGVDTQEILPLCSPTEVTDEVHRLILLLGPNIIIGPSHEVLMPNVSFANVKAMSKAVK